MLTESTPGEGLTLPFGRAWSVSAAALFDRCPGAAAQRYGPDRVKLDDHEFDPYRKRGLVLHDALSAAFTTARDDAECGEGLAGAPMLRHWGAARRELGKAWERHRMPSDPDEAQTCVDLLRTNLEVLREPARGAILAIEQLREHTTGDGVLIRYIPDYLEWVAPGVLLVRDWKSGKVDPDEVKRHRQLYCYAAWLAHELGRQVREIRIELWALRDGRGYWATARPEKAALHADWVAARALDAAHTDLAEVEYRPGKFCSGCYFRKRCPALGGRYT
jgi:hypothetical protein